MRTRRSALTSPATARSIDWVLFFTSLCLVVVGVILVYEASVVEAYQIYQDKYYFARSQLRWAALGLIVLAISTLTPLKLIKKYAPMGLLLSLACLVLVLVPSIGSKVGGARRWMDLGFFTFQPSEIAKISLLIYSAALFEKKLRVQPFFVSLLSICGLVLLQPDLDTTMVIALLSLTIYFVAGAPVTQFLGLITAGVVSTAALVITSPYRLQRLLTFFDIERDPLGASYHIRQIVIAIGSGGLFGTGIGRSLQKYRFIPAATTDSIFAVLAEETGFIGTMFIVALFLIYALRGTKIAFESEDKFNKLIAIGASMLIISQAFINLAAMAALIPLAGIPLPFISYGGSSLLVSMAATGLLLNVSRYRNVTKR